MYKGKLELSITKRRYRIGGQNEAETGKLELYQVGQKHAEAQISNICSTESKLRKLLYVVAANPGNYHSLSEIKQRKERVQEDFCGCSLFLSSVVYLGSSLRSRYKVRSDQNALSSKTGQFVISCFLKESCQLQRVFLELNLLKHLASSLFMHIFFSHLIHSLPSLPSFIH